MITSQNILNALGLYYGYKALNRDPLVNGSIAVGLFYLAQNTEGVDNMGAIRAKSVFVPPYKNLKDKDLGWSTQTNIRWAQGKAGVYLIKENGVLVYIGSGSNVYKNALRHFEPNKNRSGQRYDKTFDKYDYTVRIVTTNTVNQAYKLEQALIRKYKPRDNYFLYELEDNTPKTEEMLKEYEYIKATWETVAPF